MSGAGEEMERCIERGLPCVAFLPVGWSPEHGPEIFAPAALEFAGLVADAYASDLRGLPEALRFVLEEDRARRGQGPLRLTWLGPLGHVYPAPIGPVGTSFPLGPTGLLLGRARDNGVCLGAGHSDQTSVARRHAKVEPMSEGARVRDLSSTNGTWCRGERQPEHALRPGEELALSGALRFRLDGK